MSGLDRHISQSIGVALLVGCGAVSAYQSTQGYSGLLLVPNAQVQHRHAVDAQINNQIESEAPTRTTEVQNLIFSVGFLPRFELSGRVATVDGTTGPRIRNDLSGSAKLQLLKDWHGFSFAVGASDFGGEAQNYESRYAVADWAPVKQLRITVGAGAGDRLDGPFGGLEWAPLSWLHLLGDYDGENLNGGLRLLAPPYRGMQAYVMAATQPDVGVAQEDDVMLAGGITFTFGTPHSRRPPPPPPAQRPAALPSDLPQVTVDSSLQGWSSHEAFLEPCIPGRAGVEVEEQRYGIPVRQARMDCAENRPAEARWRSQRLSDFNPVSRRNWHNAGLQLRVDPALNTAVATEYGVFDYSLALQSSARLQLPAGLALYVTHTDPLTESEDYRPGRIYARGRFRSETQEVIGQWFAHPLPGVFLMAAGGRMRILGEDNDVSLGEIALHSPGGAHQLHGAAGEFTSRDPATAFITRDYHQVGYRYFWFKQDLSITVQRGCYLLDDCGHSLYVERFMGHVSFTAFYRRMSSDEQVGGFGISLPLTTRKQWVMGPVRAGGNPAFNYRLFTTINPPNGRNTLRPNFMVEPRLRYDLRRHLLDRDRAQPGYWPTAPGS